MDSTNKEKTLVSICIPAYNAGNFISSTISCLLNQTYNNIEIIVIDDHSTDDTVNIINNISDNRLKILTNPKKYAAAARNFAYKNSSGNYIIFFDADDLIAQDFIEKQVAKLSEDESDIVVSNWGRFYNNDLRTFEEAPFTIKQDLTYDEWILAYWKDVRHNTPPGRIIMTKKLIEKTKLWDESLTLNDDFQFFNEIFYHSKLIRYNDSIFYYRSGINGLSSKNGEQHHESSLMALRHGITLAKNKYPNNLRLEQCYANMFQNIVYEVYPNKRLTQMVNEDLQILPKPTLKFPAGGLTKILLNLVGWKLTKRIRTLLKK